MAMSNEDRKRAEDFLDRMTVAQRASVLLSFSSFCDWLRFDHPKYYQSVKQHIRELYDELKQQVNDVLNEAGEIAGDIIEGLFDVAEEGVKALKRFFS